MLLLAGWLSAERWECGGRGLPSQGLPPPMGQSPHSSRGATLSPWHLLPLPRLFSVPLRLYVQLQACTCGSSCPSPVSACYCLSQGSESLNVPGVAGPSHIDYVAPSVVLPTLNPPILPTWSELIHAWSQLLPSSQTPSAHKHVGVPGCISPRVRWQG